MNIIVAGNVQLNQESVAYIIKNNNDNICFCPDEESEIEWNPNEVDIVICNWFFKYHDLLMFTRLKYIQLISSGYNGINPDEAKRMGIVLHNAKGVYNIPISEFVVGNILAFYKKSHYFYTNQVRHRWQKSRNLQELFDKNVLIVGTGNIGIEIAKRIGAFTDYVYGCNRTVRKDDLFRNVYPIDRLIDIVPQMDILILAIAYTKDTEKIIDNSVLAKMKDNALIVNVSRGAIIDEADLINSLEEKKIGGAILDVFEDEPLYEESPLWGYDNVIVTPHNAFASEKNNERLNKLILNNYIQWRMSNGSE